MQYISQQFLYTTNADFLFKDGKINLWNGAKKGFCKRLNVEVTRQPSIISLQREPRGAKTDFRVSSDNFFAIHKTRHLGVDFNLDKVAGTISSFLSKDEFIYNVVEVNNSFYGISCNANNENVNFYKLDTENLTSEKVNDEPFQVDITDNAWVRENRIYLMNSRSTRNVYYNYFDVETIETGEGWHVRQNEIVGF